MEMEHISSQPITVRCPKCQNVLSVVPLPMPPSGKQEMSEENAQSGITKGESPQQKSINAPPPAQPATSSTNDAVQALATMLMQAMNRPMAMRNEPQERQRCVLVCLALEAERFRVQEALRGHDYDVIIAESTERAIERLQHSRLVDVLLLDESFEAEHNGMTTVMRYVNTFHLGRRRRLYVALVSPHHRTLDTQAAFSLGVNLLVNSSDLGSLPDTFKKSIREFNLLYRAFNEASGVTPF